MDWRAMMQGKKIPGGQEIKLESGAVITVTGLERDQYGRVYADVTVHDPDGGTIGSGRPNLADAFSRTAFARDIASRNSTDTESWTAVLVSIHDDFETQRKATLQEDFAPVKLAGLPEPGPMQFTVDSLVPREQTTSIFGDGGQGKSTIIGVLATCIVTGICFLGLDVIKGPVLIMDWELNQDITLERLYRIARGLGLDQPPDGLYYQSLHMSFRDALPDLRTWVDENHPELIIVDSFGPASGGDPMDQGIAVELMNSIRSVNATRLIVDHQSNPVKGVEYSSKRAFGSAWKHHLSRSAMQLEMVANVQGKISLVLRHQKHNFSSKHADKLLHLVFDGPVIRLELGSPTDPEFQGVGGQTALQRVEAIIAEFGPITADEIALELDTSTKTIMNQVSKLRSQGKLPSKSSRNGDNKVLYLMKPVS